MEFVAGHQILDITKPHVRESVTLSGGQHDGIVWQAHLGVEAAVQWVGQHQRRRTAEIAFAEFLRDQLEAQTAAIPLLQVANHDLLRNLIEVDGLVAAGAKANHPASFGGARQRRNRGADLRGNSAEDRKPGL